MNFLLGRDQGWNWEGWLWVCTGVTPQHGVSPDNSGVLGLELALPTPLDASFCLVISDPLVEGPHYPGREDKEGQRRRQLVEGWEGQVPSLQV